jgi:hypothetical protein
VGRIITPTYRAEYRDQAGWHVIAWNVRGGVNSTANGAPTDKNAEIMRRNLNASFEQNGCNYHASVAAGYLIHVSQVRLIHQATGQQVANIAAPMFEIFN